MSLVYSKLTNVGLTQAQPADLSHDYLMISTDSLISITRVQNNNKCRLVQ